MDFITHLIFHAIKEGAKALDEEMNYRAAINTPNSSTKNYSSSSVTAKTGRKIIVDKLGVDYEDVFDEASFTNDLGADSLDAVELIMEFENKFNISIPDDQAKKIITVGDAIKYIENNK